MKIKKKKLRKMPIETNTKYEQLNINKMGQFTKGNANKTTNVMITHIRIGII